MKKSDYFQELKLRKEDLREAIAEAVGAGKPVALETVDFSDPDRPKTCLEVDFPILPINQIAAIEGNAGKPIYQMSKWWARRRSSVFRSMLIAAATKAPDDPSHAAKRVWDHYYANHQKKGAFKHLKVADIFMGGGTTLVEGSRLGMQMVGNDLNPVAWFVVKQEFAKVDLDEVKRLLADIEAEVKPQIMPFYYCDGPNGEKGRWTHLPSGRVEGPDFDPLSLSPEQRRDYRYEGPEIIYTFWAKHGPCQVTGCGHRTPILSSPLMAVKTLSVKFWPYTCRACGAEFDIEAKAVRMAPDVALYVNPAEKPYAVLENGTKAVCPACGEVHKARVSPKEGLVIEGPRGQTKLGKGKNKKVEMSLLVHPEWLAGSPKADADGRPFGGSAQDDAESTARWNRERAGKIRLLEVRGELPETVICPETGVSFQTGKEGGTVPKPANFACGACGTVQPIVTAIAATGKTAPASIFAIQAYSPRRDEEGHPYGGRFFAVPSDSRAVDAANAEWERRKDTDLKDYWPRSAIPFGHMTHQRQPLPQHGILNWTDMFNSRQLLVHAQLIRAIFKLGEYSWEAREYALGGFQQFLNFQNGFCHWNIQRDCISQLFANNNFHPKSTSTESGVFSLLGSGNWQSCIEAIIESQEWKSQPYDFVRTDFIARIQPSLLELLSGKSEKVLLCDPVLGADITQSSSTDVAHIALNSLDLIITDPPFGGLLHYSELSDFFYVWLRLALTLELYPLPWRGIYGVMIYSYKPKDKALNP